MKDNETTEDEREYTGKSSSYYTVEIMKPTTPTNQQYIAEVNDIIEALGMNFAEGNIIKAVWRIAAARTLNKSKKGYDSGKYDAEKIVYYGERLVIQNEIKEDEV